MLVFNIVMLFISILFIIVEYKNKVNTIIWSICLGMNLMFILIWIIPSKPLYERYQYLYKIEQFKEELKNVK